MENLNQASIEQLLVNDLDAIAEHFSHNYDECVRAVKKPNVLVAGITGAGKSSLINSVFGTSVAKVGDGVPVTQHYTRFAPDNRPVIVYDSKGLEDGCHAQFIADTQAFLRKLRGSPDLGDHIHLIWYVINAASGRFEPFEVTLVREVFAPTPVVFVLNKADIASADQIHCVREAVERERFANSCGVVHTVSARKNWAQNWCSRCFSDDVTFRKAGNQLRCEQCGHIEALTEQFGLDRLVELTAERLPDLAKEAFLFSQQTSMRERDRFALHLVKQFASGICMDVAGKALSDVGVLISRIFILWGWTFLGSKISNALVQDMLGEYKRQELSVRLAMVAADTMVRRKLSRSMIACLGIMVNHTLRQLSQQVLALIEKHGKVDAMDFAFQDNETSQLVENFMQTVFETDLNTAIERYWGSIE